MDILFSGLNDKDDIGTWSYTNGENTDFANWSPSKPRTKRMLNKKKCIIVDKKRRWKIKICDKRKSRLICELDIGAVSGIEGGGAPPKRDISSERRSRRRGRNKDNQNDDLKNNQNKRSKRTRNDKGFFFGN